MMRQTNRWTDDLECKGCGLKNNIVVLKLSIHAIPINCMFLYVDGAGNIYNWPVKWMNQGKIRSEISIDE